MDTIVLLNRKAGTVRGRGRRAIADSVAAAFREGGCEADVRLVHPRRFGEEIDAVLARGDKPGALVVGGGDGTVSAAARALAGSDMALGVLPLGTFNLFGRAIGMPTDPAKAVAALLGARSRRIDMLEINGRTVLMHASIGLQPHVILQRDRMAHRTRAGKLWHGLRAWMRVVRRPPRMRFTARMGGTVSERVATAMLLSNNPLSGGPGEIPVSGDMGEGKLALYICTSRRRRDLVGLTLAVPFGAWRETGLVEEIVTESVEIAAARKRLIMSVDGELMTFSLPLECRVRKACVSVLFPQEQH